MRIWLRSGAEGAEGAARRVVSFAAVFDFPIQTKRGDHLCAPVNTLNASERRPTLRILDLFTVDFTARSGVAAVNVARHGCELSDEPANAAPMTAQTMPRTALQPKEASSIVETAAYCRLPRAALSAPFASDRRRGRRERHAPRRAVCGGFRLSD